MKVTATFLLMMATAVATAGQEQSPEAKGSLVSGLRAPKKKNYGEQPQGSERAFRYDGDGHAYFATGVCQHGYKHVGVGGGAEGFVWRGLTLGGSAGYHYFVDDVGFGLASLDVGYHFTDRKQPKRVDPFVSFSPLGVAFAGGGVAGAGSIGGGINYWFKERLGLRTEVRFQAVGVEESLFMFRIGFNFR